MFRFTLSAAPVAALALAAMMLVPAAGHAAVNPVQQADQAAPAAQGAPAAAPQANTPARPAAATHGRRRNLNREQRIARNIQQTYSHKYEVAGGGGFLRFRTGQDLQKITEVNFFVSGTRMFNQKWGALVEVRGMYGNANIPNIYAHNFSFSPQISEYTFMGGAQYRFVAREKWTVSGNATAGTALSKFAGDAKGLRSTDLGMWPDSNARPAFQVGVSLDYNLYQNLAVRVEPTYLATTFGSTLQNNKGVNFGVVYRFGKQ